MGNWIVFCRTRGRREVGLSLKRREREDAATVVLDSDDFFDC